MIRVFKMVNDRRVYLPQIFYTRGSARLFCRNTQYRQNTALFLEFEDGHIEKYVSYDTNRI